MHRNRITMAAILAACLSTPAIAADKAAYDKAVANAKAALDAASAVDGEWRDSRKMLKQAEKAAAQGDYDKAVKLAETAEFQGVMGKKQALQEDKVGNPNYLYN